VQLYCVNLSGIEAVRPAQEIDPVYAAALREAVAAGVEVLAYGASLTPEQMWVDRPLPVLIEPLQIDPDALVVLPAV
jgi:sugar fermentation stimulation protein A